MPCPAGAYCPAGDVPTACPLGTWANLVGQECQLKGEGTLLHLNACPAGTWNNLTGQTNITSCQMCPPDMHCEVGSRTPSAHQQEFSEPQPGELCSSLSHICTRSQIHCSLHLFVHSHTRSSQSSAMEWISRHCSHFALQIARYSWLQTAQTLLHQPPTLQ